MDWRMIARRDIVRPRMGLLDRLMGRADGSIGDEPSREDFARL
jgi:hypothetical protein